MLDWCLFFYFVVGKVRSSFSRANTAEQRSKKKTAGEGVKGENNYQESANKKTLNDRKQKKLWRDILSADVRPQNMLHHPFTKTGRSVLKISRG